MTYREFYEISDADDPRLFPAIKHYIDLSMTKADLGPELARFRPWPTWRQMGRVLLLNVIVAIPFLFWPWGPPGTNLGLATTATLMTGGLYVSAILVGSVIKHRVCADGLATGWRRRTKLVIPWETVDPGRVHIVENATTAGLHPDFSKRTMTHQIGLVDRGLLLSGFNTAEWEPNFRYWLLGTAHPEKLAQAIEKAMIEYGLPAQGLADNAVRTTAHPRRFNGGVPLLTTHRADLDPVIGVPTQSQ